MCFVWFSQEMLLISLHSTDQVVFVIETKCVYCKVGTEIEILFTWISGLEKLRHGQADTRATRLPFPKRKPPYDKRLVLDTSIVGLAAHLRCGVDLPWEWSRGRCSQGCELSVRCYSTSNDLLNCHEKPTQIDMRQRPTASGHVFWAGFHLKVSVKLLLLCHTVLISWSIATFLPVFCYSTSTCRCFSLMLVSVCFLLQRPSLSLLPFTCGVVRLSLTRYGL